MDIEQIRKIIKKYPRITFHNYDHQGAIIEVKPKTKDKNVEAYCAAVFFQLYPTPELLDEALADFLERLDSGEDTSEKPSHADKLRMYLTDKKENDMSIENYQYGSCENEENDQIRFSWDVSTQKAVIGIKREGADEDWKKIKMPIKGLIDILFQINQKLGVQNPDQTIKIHEFRKLFSTLISMLDPGGCISSSESYLKMRQARQFLMDSINNIDPVTYFPNKGNDVIVQSPDQSIG